ncbi:MAG: hypothetical protein ACP5G0_01280 [Desulfomonilia bacterium]
MNNTIIIEKRFCGPPDSGNGGYVCGLLAGNIQGVATVTLRKPPPLETALRVEVIDGGKVVLKDRDSIIAEARPSSLDMEIPAPPTFEDAQQATRTYLSPEEHFFPTCFVCGPARTAGDGLRIFPSSVPGTSLVASPWIPDKSLCDGSGRIRPEFVWASLDCPGAFAVLDKNLSPVVLGELTAQIIRLPVPDEPYIVVGWELSRKGRKRFAGTALYSRSGEIFGMGKAVWIELTRVS